MCVNAGMWFERFIIIVGGLHRDFLPSSWGLFIPTWVDIWTFIGTHGIFPLALPPLHSLPANDRDERSENRFAGIGRHRHDPVVPAEKEHA